MTKESIKAYLERTRATNHTLEHINEAMGIDFSDPEIAEVFFEEWAQKLSYIRR